MDDGPWAPSLISPLYGIDDLVAWILADQADLEDEARSRRVFPFYAKKKNEKWKVERVEIKNFLEQADSYARSLVGDLEILHDDVLFLCNELRCAREMNACDSFALGLLQSKCDSTRAQLSFVYGEFDLEKGHARTRLSPFGKN